MKTIDSSIWEYEIISENGKKILCLICELPDEEMLRIIDLSKQFQQGIYNQVYQIIEYLKGCIPQGICLVNYDDMNNHKYMSDEEDVAFLMFQKHYLCSTQTIALIKDPSVADVIDINDGTSRFFKDGKIIKKHNMKAVFDNKRLNFILGNPVSIEFTDSDIEELKAKIY